MDNNFEGNGGLSDVEVLQGLGFAPTAETQSTLLGKVQQMTPGRRQAAFAAVRKTSFGSNNKSVRDLVIERLDSLPKDIIAGLTNKRLQIVEAEYYDVKLIKSATQITFFDHADTVAAGVTNVNNGKFKKDEWFLLCGVQYQEGIGTANSADHTGAKTAVFSTPFANGANGDFDLQANSNKYVLPERSPISMFSDVSSNGGYKSKLNSIALDNPKWIEPDVKFGAIFRYGTANATDYVHGKLKLIGAQIIAA